MWRRLFICKVIIRAAGLLSGKPAAMVEILVVIDAPAPDSGLFGLCLKAIVSIAAGISAVAHTRVVGNTQYCLFSVKRDAACVGSSIYFSHIVCVLGVSE